MLELIMRSSDSESNAGPAMVVHALLQATRSATDAVDGSLHRHRDVAKCGSCVEQRESAYGYKQT